MQEQHLNTKKCNATTTATTGKEIRLLFHFDTIFLINDTNNNNTN